MVQTAAKPAAPREGQVIANRFVVRRLLGQGGMGRVYAVQDRQIEGRDVALKVLLPKYSKNAHFKKLFFQEVRAAQEFVSEYICQVRDTGETEDGSLFFTMDLVEGEALRAMLDREKSLGPRHALEITRQVLLGLQSGHEKGFVHRDIKPSNVMLAARVAKTDANPYGVGVRLLDFGIAGLASEIDERSRAGTVMYMSPEQASGERLDPRSDLFAVGVLLFEMLSGHRPFDGSTTRALVQSVLETNLTARLGEIPNLPKPLRRLMERALQKDRNKRFQSASEFADAIAKSAAYKLPQNVPSWAYGALAVALLAVAAEGYVLLSRSGEIARIQGELDRAGVARLDAVKLAEETKDSQIRAEVLAHAQTKLAAAEADSKRVEAERSAGDLDAQLKAAQADVADKQNQISRLQGDLIDVQKVKNTTADQLAALTNDVRTQEKEIERLKDERDTAMRLSSPKGLVATAFDAVTDLVAGGFGDSARKKLAEFEGSAVFAKEGQLKEFLQALVEASASIETHTKSRQAGKGPRLSAIRAAENSLRGAREDFPALEVAAGEWQSVPLADQTVPTRLANANALLNQLSAEVARELSTSVAEDLSSWKTMDLGNLLRDPEPVFEHLDRYGCSEHLPLAAEKLLASLKQEMAPGDVLDVDALRGARALAPWVRLLEKDTISPPKGTTDDLRLFELAQRWYDADDANDAFDWKLVGLEPIHAVSKSWRHVLQLEHALSQPDSGYPIRRHGQQLFRQVDERGVVAYVEDQDKSGDSGTNRWTITRRIADANGQFSPDSSDLVLERVDNEIRVPKGSMVYLNLKARGGTLSVEPLPNLIDGAVPQSLLSTSEREDFRKIYLADGGQPCLVVTSGDITRWISPKFGLVREKILGGWTRDLVYWRGTQ